MKSLISSILVTLAAVTLASAEVKNGSPAPDFTLTDTNGKEVKLSDYKGKLVVLEWTNNECPFVKKHYASNNMQKLQKEMTGQDVVWLSIISSASGKQGHCTPEEANKLVKESKSAPSAVLLDPKGEVGRLYAARTTPQMFVIDKAGVVQYQGAIDSDSSPNADKIPSSTNYVQQAVSEIKAGKPVSEPVTKPYGCSVKY